MRLQWTPLLASVFLYSLVRSAPRTNDTPYPKDASVLILGGGLAGVIAARTFHEQGIVFTIVEARHELGGRMQSFTFGAPGRQYTLESGANWVQGTESDSGTENPVWGLAKAHGLKTQENDWEGSISQSAILLHNAVLTTTSIATYDATGQVDYLDTFQESLYQFESLGAVVRQTSRRLVNVSARTGYSLIGAKPRTAHAMACEYFQIDWDTGKSVS